MKQSLEQLKSKLQVLKNKFDPTDMDYYDKKDLETKIRILENDQCSGLRKAVRQA